MEEDILFVCYICHGTFYKKARYHKGAAECTPECHSDFCDLCVNLSVASMERQFWKKPRLRLEAKTS